MSQSDALWFRHDRSMLIDDGNTNFIAIATWMQNGNVSIQSRLSFALPTAFSSKQRRPRNHTFSKRNLFSHNQSPHDNAAHNRPPRSPSVLQLWWSWPLDPGLPGASKTCTQSNRDFRIYRYGTFKLHFCVVLLAMEACDWCIIGYVWFYRIFWDGMHHRVNRKYIL